MWEPVEVDTLVVFFYLMWKLPLDSTVTIIWLPLICWTTREQTQS